MAFFQTTWRDGSSFNHNLTENEYFYEQIYRAIKNNVEKKTLPFFNSRADSLPVEITTGKIINDENLIALEQSAAKNGYTSNIWIYGNTMEKLQKENICLNLKKNAEPVLCLTKYSNSTHLNEEELYIAEGGSRSKAQYLYNYDSLDDRSKNAVRKYFPENMNVQKNSASDCFRNFLENIRKTKTEEIPRLTNLKKNIRTAAQNIANTYTKDTGASINLSPIMNAQARHICQTITAAGIKSGLNQGNEDACYEVLSKMIEDVEKSGTAEWKAGKSLAKALDAGTLYAKSYTAKDFNMEVRKIREENNHKKENLKKRTGYGMEY